MTPLFGSQLFTNSSRDLLKFFKTKSNMATGKVALKAAEHSQIETRLYFYWDPAADHQFPPNEQ